MSKTTKTLICFLLLLPMLLFAARVAGDLLLDGALSFEGATADAFETTISPTDPTADRTVTLPDADSVTVQGTTCTSGDFVSAVNASTGVITCTTPSAAPSYIELFNWRSGIAIGGGYSTTNFAGGGLYTSTTLTSTGTNVQSGTLQFQDANGEVAYFVGWRFATEKGVTTTNLGHVNFESEMSIQTSTANNTVTFFLGVSCFAPGEATNTGFTSLTYTSLTSMTGTSNASPGTLFVLTSTDQDLTSECAVGDVPVYKIEGDETSVGYDNIINFMTFRVWTD